MSRNHILAVTGWLVVIGLSIGVPAAASATDAGAGQVFVIHGLPGVTADVLVDGRVVEEKASPSAVIGPFDVAPGGHTVALRPQAGNEVLEAVVDVQEGMSVDVVAHRPADPEDAPVLTIFPNDMSAVAPDKSRLVVAHTAAVPPADIRVAGVVLLSNVANAEALTVVVPEDTYNIDIVPTAASEPVLFGPVDLPVSAGQLTRVFAFGDPGAGTMDAVVHRLPLATTGHPAPTTVATGDGGQFAQLSARPPAEIVAVWAAGLLVLSLMAARRRMPAR